MSILSRLKNKLQDPALNETKMREFDECMSLLKNENIELHKRLDQLEALYQTNINIQQTHFLEEHIRELEQENGRLFAENQCQREDYERFLDQLTTMVIRTAVMQENIRKECAAIFHVIEHLSDATNAAIQINYPVDGIKEARKKILKKLGKDSTNVSNELVPSALSSSSLTTHCALSTSNSGSPNLPIKTSDTKPQRSVSNIPKEKNQPVLQRSETFIISKTPQTELSSCGPITVNDPHVNQRPIIRPMGSTASASLRPSRLPSRCSNSKVQSSNNVNNNRALSSKLPIRTTSSLNRQQTPVKKSNIPTPVVSKIKKDLPIISNRSILPVKDSTIKKRTPSRPPVPVIQLSLNKTRSRSIPTTEKNNIPLLLNKCPRTTKEESIEQTKSTSSESSIEEQQQQHINNLLPTVQDEGYSTWSSIDVKDDVIRKSNDIEKNEIDDRQKNLGLVKTWLDTSNRQCSKTPVEEVEIDQLEEFSVDLTFLCPFVRNRCSNVKPIPLPSMTISFSDKDISLDSLNSPQSNEPTITSSSSSFSTSSSSTFSRSETFEQLLITQTLSNMTNDLTDSTSSASSTFNMSEYIEDHFIDHDDNTSEVSSLFESTILNKNLPLKPQKRLLFPGLLNRLIFSRRILSDSDLQRKEFYLNEHENSSHVYHSNIINEHSVEVNLINTYGSDSELHVWSHDCAEQRRFLDERQQTIEGKESYSQQELAIERQRLLQQIYEYPWLLQENDLDRTTRFSSSNITSPIPDLIVPSHNPDFYQLCALTNSSSFVISYDPNTRHNTPSTTSSVL